MDMSNTVYYAVNGITASREADGSYNGSGHHLAQEISAAVCKAIEERFDVTEKVPAPPELASK